MNYSHIIFSIALKDQSQAGNYDQLLEDVQEIVTRNQENNRTSNVWCHFGKVHIDYGSLAGNSDIFINTRVFLE